VVCEERGLISKVGFSCGSGRTLSNKQKLNFQQGFGAVREFSFQSCGQAYTVTGQPATYKTKMKLMKLRKE
jgi:hypothetical protein